jgi:phosphoribosylformylglycinamidine (FGAM) synthase-like enzyme
VDLDGERRLHRLLVAAAQGGLLRSAHDASEGGLAVTLAEAAMGGPYSPEGLGASVDLAAHAPGVPPEGLLYGEDAGRIVVSAAPDRVAALEALAAEHGVPVSRAGRVGPPSGNLELRVGGSVLSWPIPTLRRIYFEAIPRRMQHPDVDRSAGE